MWDITRNKLHLTIHNKKLPYSFCLVVYNISLIHYFFYLLLGYDWRYARNWVVFMVEKTFNSPKWEMINRSGKSRKKKPKEEFVFR